MEAFTRAAAGDFKKILKVVRTHTKSSRRRGGAGTGGGAAGYGIQNASNVVLTNTGTISGR
jgi:hypothetical protein